MTRRTFKEHKPPPMLCQ